MVPVGPARQARSSRDLGSGGRVGTAPAIKGDMGRQRPDLFQILLGIWVVIGLVVLAIVVARSLP